MGVANSGSLLRQLRGVSAGVKLAIYVSKIDMCNGEDKMLPY